MKGYGRKHLASKAFLTIPMVLAFVGGIQAQAEDLVTAESSQPEVSLTQSSAAEVKSAPEADALATASSESQATVSTQQESSETSTYLSSNVSSEVTSSTASSETASLTSTYQTNSLSSETSSVSSTPVTASSENAVSSVSTTASTTSLTSESAVLSLVQGYAADVTNLPVTSVAQKDQALTIQYNRPISSDEVIKIAVWSDLKGQDDLKWYTADKLGAAYVELKNHRDYGKYNIHTYADRSGRMVGLNATELTVVAPAKPSITVSSKSVSVFDVTISNVPNTISSVKVPVWTNHNGQDDLIWYTANKQASGTYRVTVDTKNHKNETGQYHIHAYGQASGSLQLQGLTTATYTVTPSQADAVKQPSVSVVAKGETAFVATITNVPSTISSVKVPVWTNQNGQDDLVWYTAAKEANGTYRVTVDTKNHKSETGQYHVHFYGQESGRSQLVGLAASTYTVPTPKPKETLATTSIVKVSTSDYQKENGKVTVVVDAGAEAPSVKLVRVAAWSESNQSNLKWYTATDLKNGQVQITVDTANHKYIDGSYTIHTYIDYQDGSTKGFNLGNYILESMKHPSTSASQGDYSVINKVIYLDAGHGGSDPGAVYFGQTEKSLNLQVQEKLKTILENSGYQVVLTRTGDGFLDLLDRSKKANSSNSDLFISIHFNASTNSATNGVETYYYQSYAEYPSAINKEFHNNSERLSRSNYLAQALQSEIVANTGALNRGVQRDTFAVLRETTAPAVLLELGYMSNVSEANKIKQENYQNKLVNGIFSGIKKYYDYYV
ncbi:GBS Bsp-like repeat-containing protein [Streptococcus porcorum]|uniref:N-acetylmuramoyl-L-alanine amidase n=1 Tax=Streptococcus porcorum TaxID=701526 RepID=A0ABV2JF02_9STRE